MKTIPVSLIAVGLLIPAFSFAQEQPTAPQPATPAPPEHCGGHHRCGEGGHHSFEEFWNKIDKDHDGFLSKEEFNALPRLQELSQEKRDEIFKRLDKDNDGKLSAEEMKQMRPHPRIFQHIREIVKKDGGMTLEQFKADPMIQKIPAEKQDALFKRLDTDGDGKITPQDKPIERPPHDGPPRGERIRHMIEKFDKDGDGAVSFEEFRQGHAEREKNHSEEELRKRFDALDRNHDGKISPEDLPPPPAPPEGGNPPPAPAPEPKE